MMAAITERVYMLPLVCVIGKSGSGKTTLIEKLIPEFKKRGYKIAVVKHTHHQIDVDEPGKDSWRFGHAGSDAVIISSPNKLAYIEHTDHDSSLDEVLQLISQDFDMIIVEGFKWSDAPKIEVHRDGLQDGLMAKPEELIAIATDRQLNTPFPQLLLDDVSGIADAIEDGILVRQ
jgi:molybdopterin-guanine dinucleotide biosynthesis protein MobB